MVTSVALSSSDPQKASVCHEGWNLCDFLKPGDADNLNDILSDTELDELDRELDRDYFERLPLFGAAAPYGSSLRRKRLHQRRYREFGAAYDHVHGPDVGVDPAVSTPTLDWLLTHLSPASLTGMSAHELFAMLRRWLPELRSCGRMDLVQVMRHAYQQAVTAEREQAGKQLVSVQGLLSVQEACAEAYRAFVLTGHAQRRREKVRSPRPRHSEPTPPTAPLAPPQA